MSLDRSIAVVTVLVLALGAVASVRAATGWHAPPEADLRRLLEERVARAEVAGLALGVLEDGTRRVVGAGRTGGDGSPLPDGETLFEIGSVSKVFTTTLLADMVARGEVALDDPIGKYLPEGVTAPSRDGKAITLLDLATQSSGLPRLPTNFAPADPSDPYADYDADDLYAFLSQYELPRAPGESYEYSNLGVGLLGHLLARRAGTSYEELVTRRVLAPLGMSETHVELSPALRERLATGHGADGEPVPPWGFDVLAGAGGWRSTPNDMLRFLAAYLSPPEGPLGAAMRSAIEPRRPTGTPNLSIGLGWHVLEHDGRKIVWHNGGTGGFHSFVGFDPESGGNVVLLASSAADVDDLGLHVVEPTMPLRELPAPQETMEVAPEVLERYVGRYEVSPAFALAITREGTTLYVQGTGQQRLRLSAASPTKFVQAAVGAVIEFQVDDAGTVTGLVLHQGGRDILGRRVP